MDKRIVKPQCWVALAECRPIGVVKPTSEIASHQPRPGRGGVAAEIEAIQSSKVATDLCIVFQRPDRADIFADIFHPDACRLRLFVNLITVWRSNAIRQASEESRLIEQNFSLPIKMTAWVITAIIPCMGRACGSTHLLEHQRPGARFALLLCAASNSVDASRRSSTLCNGADLPSVYHSQRTV